MKGEKGSDQSALLLLTACAANLENSIQDVEMQTSVECHDTLDTAGISSFISSTNHPIIRISQVHDLLHYVNFRKWTTATSLRLTKHCH